MHFALEGTEDSEFVTLWLPILLHTENIFSLSFTFPISWC